MRAPDRKATTLWNKHDFGYVRLESDADIDAWRRAHEKHSRFRFVRSYESMIRSFCDPRHAVSLHLDVERIFDETSRSWWWSWPFNKNHEKYDLSAGPFSVVAARNDDVVEILEVRRKVVPPTAASAPELASRNLLSFQNIEDTATCQFLRQCWKTSTPFALRDCAKELGWPTESADQNAFRPSQSVV